MFGLRSLQNLRIHAHGRRSGIYDDRQHTGSSKDNSKADTGPQEPRGSPPQWLDRDADDLPRPRTSPMESGSDPFASASFGGPAGMLVEAKHKIFRKSTTSDQLFHVRHRQRRSTTCIVPLRRDAETFGPNTNVASDVEIKAEVADDTRENRAVESDEPVNDNSDEGTDTDTEILGRRAQEWQRTESVHLHPGPLNSNPTRDDDDSTPRATVSFTAEMQAKLSDIRGSLINRIGRPTSRWWEDDASGERPPGSPTPPTPRIETAAVAPALSSVSVTPVLRASAIFDEPELFIHQQLADLKSENITLKSLKKLHEEAISNLREEKLSLADQKAALEVTISEAESKLHAQKATMDRQKSTISKLSRQLSSKDTEHGALVTNFSTELASRDNELIALKDEKWTLQRKVTELEQMIAQTEAEVQQWGRMGRRIPRKLRMSSLGDAEGDISTTSSSSPDANISDERGGQSVTENQADINSGTAGGLMILDAPTAGSPKSRVGDIGNHNFGLSSPFPPGTSPSNSLSGWAATTSSRSIRPLFNFQSPPTLGNPTPEGIQATSTASTSSGTRPSSRRRRSLSSQTTAVAMAEEDGVVPMSRPLTNQDQTHQRGQSVAQQPKVLTAENLGLEKNFLSRLNKQDSLNDLGILGSAKGASHMATVERLLHKSPSMPILPSLSTPELPVLTYGRSLTVWLDRVVTTFKYLNLSAFLRPSDSAAVNTAERLRAAILLKSAVNDDILEDVLVLLSRKETQTNPTSTESVNSASECPHLLLSAISTIHGLVSGSPSEVGWVDRISEAELGGLEDFASLVLCIDKRRSTMFGANTEHYDSMLPKIQESAAQRVPEADNPPTSDVVGGPGPKKKSQLSTWMGGLVKRRQTRLESEQVAV